MDDAIFTLMTNVKFRTLTERVELFNIHADNPYTIKAFVDLSRDATNVVIPDTLDVVMVLVKINLHVKYLSVI